MKPEDFDEYLSSVIWAVVIVLGFLWLIGVIGK